MRFVYEPMALDGLREAGDYLLKRFGRREAQILKTLLVTFEQQVSKNPELYPIYRAGYPYRKAALHHRFIAVYVILDDAVSVIDAWDTRQDR